MEYDNVKLLLLLLLRVIVWAAAYTNGEFDVAIQYHMTRHAT